MKRHLHPWFLTVIALWLAVPALATIFGRVRGIVHDPQHRPVPGAAVSLKARNSDWAQSEQTNENGEFEFEAVPLGEYVVTVSRTGFQPASQDVVLQSETTPVLHFPLSLAVINEKTVVVGEPVIATTDSVTPDTLVNRRDVQTTPGADRSNSLAMITDYVPGSYITHDQLHIRGGHQVSWLVDGVPVPNTNIAGNVGPQFDPKDIDYLEVQRGSYDADYGDRTYGVFNVVPRTGFERDKECDLVTSFGTFYQTNDQISCGGHTQRFAYYGSLNGNRSNLGLETPIAQVLHDAENGYGGFGSLIFNADASNQLRLVTSLRRDYYQIPFDPNPNSPDNLQFNTSGLRDAQHEADALVNFSWVHTFNPNVLLTVSPFFHYNSANYASSPSDTPVATTDDRASNYAGGQATWNVITGPNTVNAGFYGFWQRDRQFFDILPRTDPAFPALEILTGNLEEIFLEDKLKLTPWLTLSGGVRQSHFSGNLTDNATSPRAGMALRLPRLNWVFRGFYGHFYQAPPLDTLTAMSAPFVPLHGERDEEFQFGVTMPYKGWALDADTFRTRANNFFDHANLGESNIFLPLALQEALIRGWELTLRSPQLWGRGQLHLAYSNQIAEFRGGITGGLTSSSFQPVYLPLDHDQRNTLAAGFSISLPRKTFVATNVAYGSGFWNGSGPAASGAAPCCSALDYLPEHTTVDLTLGKTLRENLAISVTALNVTNRHLLTDNSLTFGGFHFNNPREVYVELRYRLHY